MAGRYYSVSMRVDGRNVLVVGGGVVAQRKAEVLLEHGAVVTVVSPEATPQVRAWAEAGRVRWLSRAFVEDDLADCRLVFCATDDGGLNRRVSALAEQRRLPVNVVDQPDLCSFIVPSQFRREHLSVAVGTDGLCPSYSRWVRQVLERAIDPAYGQALAVAAKVRERVYASFQDADYDTRRRVMEAVLSLDLPAMVRTQGAAAAESAAEQIVRSWASGPSET